MVYNDNRPMMFPEDPLTPMMPTRQGGIPMWRQDDAKQPAQFQNGHVDVFNMNNEEDWNDYNQVVNAAAHGQVIICREEVNFNAATGEYQIFVRWMERYYAMTEDVQGRLQTDANGSIVYPNMSSKRRRRFIKTAKPQEEQPPGEPNQVTREQNCPTPTRSDPEPADHAGAV